MKEHNEEEINKLAWELQREEEERFYREHYRSNGPEQLRTLMGGR